MTTLTQQLRAVRQQVGAPSKSTARSCDWDDVRAALREARAAKRRVRVYSAAGFVPHSYRYRCQIQFVEVTKAADGRLTVRSGWTGAQRSRGQGSLIVVQ
jgi:hypothetical protein